MKGKIFDCSVLSIYLILATGFTALLLILMPPYQNADESAHFMRADHISRGGIIGHRDGKSSGGTIDAELMLLGGAVQGIPFHTENKINAEALKSAARIHWNGATFDAWFQNTAPYPPTLYFPSVLSIWVGKALDLSVLNTLLLARATNALTTITLACAAMFLARGKTLAFAAVFLLPMSAALAGAVSQDGPLLGLSALYGALIANALRGRGGLNGKGTVFAALVITAVVMARPPYAPALMLLPLAATNPRHGWTAVAGALAAVGGWSMLAASEAVVVMTFPEGTPNPSEQLQTIALHPIQSLAVLANTVDQYGWPWVKQMIGVLGWLDTRLPQFFYIAACSIVLLICGVTFEQEPQSRHPRSVGLALAAIAPAMIVGIMVIQYLYWSQLNAPVVAGVQGRYFLPVLLMLIPFLPGIRIKENGVAHTVLIGTFAGWALVTIVVTVWAVVNRYYLSAP
ncbi:DUF2142 domain-containing protein [Methylohalobius crimeensis]|uniref:DUF2142 domain-containing protein n=1 Tax=Methylohalobius crimeensis TaxID=244365 RepID=UPI0003B46485|nr:DUF2142 domain-containing protein [Methylohalobius crimeensis]